MFFQIKEVLVIMEISGQRPIDTPRGGKKGLLEAATNSQRLALSTHHQQEISSTQETPSITEDIKSLLSGNTGLQKTLSEALKNLDILYRTIKQIHKKRGDNQPDTSKIDGFIGYNKDDRSRDTSCLLNKRIDKTLSKLDKLLTQINEKGKDTTDINFLVDLFKLGVKNENGDSFQDVNENVYSFQNVAIAYLHQGRVTMEGMEINEFESGGVNSPDQDIINRFRVVERELGEVIGELLAITPDEEHRTDELKIELSKMKYIEDAQKNVQH